MLSDTCPVIGGEKLEGCPDLAQVGRAFGRVSGIAHGGHGGDEDGSQNADDGDDCE